MCNTLNLLFGKLDLSSNIQALYPLLMLLFLLVVLPFFQLASEISVLSLIPLISSLSQSDDSFQLFFAVFPHFISIELLTHQNFLIILSSLASASSD